MTVRPTCRAEGIPADYLRRRLQNRVVTLEDRKLVAPAFLHSQRDYYEYPIHA
jgi:hypothetical protein